MATQPANSSSDNKRVESDSEALMLQQMLQQGKVRPENVYAAEQALKAYIKESEDKRGRRMSASGRLGPGSERDAHYGAGAEPHRLGPGASTIVRPLAEGMSGMVTAPVDAATWVGNKLGILPFKGTLTRDVQRAIDRYTTRPKGRAAKTLELLGSTGVGALGGPKLPRFGKMPAGTRNFLRENPEVTLPPGMRRGGVANYLEQQAAKMHPAPALARRTAVRQWNTSDINRVLKSINAPELPPGVEGRNALRYLHQQISQGYDRLFKSLAIDPDKGLVPLRARLDQIKQAHRLDPEQTKILNHVIDKIILQQPPPAVAGQLAIAQARSGVAPNVPKMRNLKEIDRVLRTESKRATAANTHQDDALNEALKQVKKAVNDVGYEQNNSVWREYREHDSAWGEWATDVRASKGGFFTPASKRQAMTRADPSRDARFSKVGDNPKMERVEEAERVLGNTEPDSGTTAGVFTAGAGQRALDMLTASGAGAEAAVHGLPGAMGVVGLYGSPFLGYNQPVMRLLQRQAMRDTPKLFSGPGAFMGARQDLQPEDAPPLSEELARQLGVVQ